MVEPVLWATRAREAVLRDLLAALHAEVGHPSAALREAQVGEGVATSSSRPVAVVEEPTWWAPEGSEPQAEAAAWS